MINFPFFRHIAIKLIFQDNVEINEKFINRVAKTLIKKLKLDVVSQNKHEFTNNGLTKIWILSQSHLIIHSWPEKNALHIDLMTCNQSNPNTESLKNYFVDLFTKEIVVTELKY